MSIFERSLHDRCESEWLRPKTTKRYMHPQKSKRMFTLWCEGKIIFGEVEKGVDWRSYPELDCSGIWLVHTKYARLFDHHKTVDSLHENGTPIHKISNGFGGFSVDMEAFCNTERKTTCFIKVSVKNNAPYKAQDKIGFVVRSGKEKTLVHGSPNEYVSYMPEIAEFKHVSSTFKQDNGVLRDGDVFITTSSSLPLCFDETAGILWAELCLEAKENAEIVLSFGKGKEFDFEYEEEKAKTIKTKFCISSLRKYFDTHLKV